MDASLLEQISLIEFEEKIMKITFIKTSALLASLVLVGCQNSPAGSQLNDGSERSAADSCLDGQDLNAEHVDISACPSIPNYPERAEMAGRGMVSLGAWELGTTSTGEYYKYGSLTSESEEPRKLVYGGGEAEVDDVNLSCWAAGYYRLRAILQNPPSEYVALVEAGFQSRFFQFQTDLRNGPTGFMQISSYMDHLVKWVTVVDEDGTCIEPTLEKFTNYAASELSRRGLTE